MKTTCFKVDLCGFPHAVNIFSYDDPAACFPLHFNIPLSSLSVSALLKGILSLPLSLQLRFAFRNGPTWGHLSCAVWHCSGIFVCRNVTHCTCKTNNRITLTLFLSFFFVCYLFWLISRASFWVSVWLFSPLNVILLPIKFLKTQDDLQFVCFL